MEAIKAFPPGKAAGPDGCEFYKTVSEALAPLLLRMFTDSTEINILPKSLYEATICVMLKRGRETTDPANYRPIALLNFDKNIITKVLADRLNKHATTIIHPDQTGFIPGRFSFSNVRRLLSILYANQGRGSRAAVISLDAQKAFYQIEWSYMFEALTRFGFGDSFITWVKMLYACPTSSILTNNDTSSLFELQRSVQKGCPLSPLLFAVTLEPLVTQIRAHPNIQGLKVGNIEMFSLPRYLYF
uniref:Reverse transcriptase domain-containing protein n=1 Tax=Oncorhynchus mykiss TaxID=8022 RepID=A0A8K9WRI9_ONCMY